MWRLLPPTSRFLVRVIYSFQILFSRIHIWFVLLGCSYPHTNIATMYQFFILFSTIFYPSSPSVSILSLHIHLPKTQKSSPTLVSNLKNISHSTIVHTNPSQVQTQKHIFSTKLGSFNPELVDLCAYKYKLDNPTKDTLWSFDDDNVNNCNIEVCGNSSQHSDDGD